MSASEDSVTIGFEIQKTWIDQDTKELVVEYLDTLSNEPTEVRLSLAEIAGKADDVAEHSVSIHPEDIDVADARERISNFHDGVDAEDVVIQRIDAPSEVYYDIRGDNA